VDVPEYANPGTVDIAMTCPVCGATGQTGISCASCGITLPRATAEPAALEKPQKGFGSKLGKVLLGLIAVAMALCVVLIIVGSVPSVDALVLSIVAATIPALVIGWIIVRLDRYEPEPPRALAAAFLWGAVGAVFLSIIGSLLVTVATSSSFSEASPVLVAPIVEETFKGIALVFLTYTYRRELDNTLDGLIYGALIGLGFAFTENILYFGQAYLEDGLIGLGALFIARAVFGGFGHAIYTGVIGAAIGWARGRYFKGVLRFIVPFLGWCLAVFLHATWNAGAMGIWQLVDGNDNFIVGIGSLALVVILPGLLLLAVVARMSHRRELGILRDQLASEVTAGTLTREEYAVITDDHLRRQRLREAGRTGGRPLRRQQKRFFDTAAELAYRKHHVERGDPLPPGQSETEPIYRAQLASLRSGLPS
jgi:RsiW-degrading membrane proteinase PrsW (M82 family)